MPQYTELLSKYSLHMYLIEKALGVFNQQNLKMTGDLEQTIATGVDGSNGTPSSSDIFNNVIKEMSGPRMSTQDKLRMAIVLVSSINLSEANI